MHSTDNGTAANVPGMDTESIFCPTSKSMTIGVLDNFTAYDDNIRAMLDLPQSAILRGEVLSSSFKSLAGSFGGTGSSYFDIR
jgi:hypothetical protein